MKYSKIIVLKAKLGLKWKMTLKFKRKKKKGMQLWESIGRHFELLSGNKQRIFLELLGLAQIETRKHRFRVMLVLMLTSASE